MRLPFRLHRRPLVIFIGIFVAVCLIFGQYTVKTNTGEIISSEELTQLLKQKPNHKIKDNGRRINGVEHINNSVEVDILAGLSIRTRVPFGNPDTNELCADDYCYINGREIKRELLRETPEDTFTFVPGPADMLPEFRNPCWKGADLLGNTKLFCLPYFYIIGFTKCGTTDLFSLLKQHPHVSSRSGKESHYFDRLRRGRSPKMNRRPENLPVSMMGFANSGKFRINLLSTFKNTDGQSLFHGITMDATPSHVWDNEYWEVFHPGYREPPVTNADLIHTLTPNARIIVALRDPIKRMQSAYQFFCAFHVYNCDYPVTKEKFHGLVKEAVGMFNDCLANNTVRGCTYATESHQLATHLYGSIYNVYLRDWLKLFPQNQVMVLQLEERIENEAYFIQSICDFLEIPRFPEDELKEMLEVHHVRNKLKETKRIEYILPETIDILKDFFIPHLQDLVELLGDDKWSFGYF